MAKVETIRVALPPEMAEALREAVADGGYASSSEIVSEGRNWQQQRQRRDGQMARLKAEIDHAARNPQRLTDEDVGAHFDKLLASTLATKAS